jgi:hypothetical protein
MKNNSIRRSAVDIEVILKEAAELARIFGAIPNYSNHHLARSNHHSSIILHR